MLYFGNRALTGRQELRHRRNDTCRVRTGQGESYCRRTRNCNTLGRTAVPSIARAGCCLLSLQLLNCKAPACRLIEPRASSATARIHCALFSAPPNANTWGCTSCSSSNPAPSLTSAAIIPSGEIAGRAMFCSIDLFFSNEFIDAPTPHWTAKRSNFGNDVGPAIPTCTGSKTPLSHNSRRQRQTAGALKPN